MEIGEIIKENRSIKNMTQEDLANEFFVSRQLISKWENGKSYPDLEQLLKLSDFFELTLDELMRGDKKMTKKLNTSIKRKPLFISLITVLLIIIVIIGYVFWAEQAVYLTPSDIEVTKIKVEPNSSIKKTNIDTKESILLPEDVSYIITYKIKKPFVRMRTGHYMGQDDNNLYIDMTGTNSLFSADKEKSLYILSDARTYEDEQSTLRIDKDYVPSVIKNKDIKVLNMEKFNGTFNNADSWTLIEKSELKQ